VLESVFVVFVGKSPIVVLRSTELLGLFVPSRSLHGPRNPFEAANAILVEFALAVIFSVHCLKICAVIGRDYTEHVLMGL
jgi:hypothetical protein